MKNSAVVAAVIAALLSGATVALAGEEKAACSVCGYLVDESEALSAEYEGVMHHFCSPDCKAYFDRDPKVIAAGNDIDAVCGATVNKAKAVAIVHNNRRNHFCSEACKEKYLANPGEYELNYDVVGGKVLRQKEMMHTSNFEGTPLYFETAENKAAFEKNPDAYVYASCPVTGKTFLRKDAGSRLEHGGKTLYFCCESCMAKFKGDPKKYLDRPRGAKYEECLETAKGSKECTAKKHGDEGCQKLIESGAPVDLVPTEARLLVSLGAAGPHQAED